MSQLQHARLPSPARAGRASNTASISLNSSYGPPAASSAFGNGPQELLGLSSGPAPMSIPSSAPRTSSQSSATGQQLHATNITSDYDFPQDLDLTDPQGSQQQWEGYQISGNNNNDDSSNNDNVADPLQRLASAEPEQLPWSGIHLNGVLPSQSQRGQMQHLSPTSMNVGMGQRRSIVGSHANETDEGYCTYSQPDLRSVCSGDSGQMHRIRPGQSSVPRTIPSTQGQSGLALYNADPFCSAMKYQTAESMEQQPAGQVQHEPHVCAETRCTFTCKTMSDLKKHTARHRREHVCDRPNCTRADKGFATINDLERHRKTVHGVEPSHGQSRMYKCFSANCKQWEKEWPRLDNFKQHLVRMHKTESTEDLIRQSNGWYETEKKPRQSTSISGRETVARNLQLCTSGPNQASKASSLLHQSQDYLSPTWQPTANSVRLQQTTNPGRPRHSSLSSQPNSSPRASGLGPPLFRHFQSDSTSFGGAHRPGPTSVGVVPAQLSSEFLIDSSHYLPRGRFNAYTVPNPDTSALSDLPETSLSSHSGALATTQDDLAHIASNFSPEQPLDLPSSDQELHSPSSPTNRVGQSSSPSPFSIEAIRALIDRSAGGPKSGNAAFLQRIMAAGIEKLKESQHPPVTATTTPSSPSVVNATLTSHPASVKTRLTFRCPEDQCQRTYARPCDLKKHLKRHHRPYGCTFSKCYERFGSKYDWKRHENSQHFQHECWKCGLCPNSTAKNGEGPSSLYSAQLFYKKKDYVTHLVDDHFASSDTIREHLHVQRIGRNCQTRFWCGFCEKIVVLKKKGLEGADERFNHIDDHFKQKRDISFWVEMDGSMAKGQQPEMDREEDVMDVLGSDGIGGGEITGEGDLDDDEEMHEDDAYDADGGGSAGDARTTTGQKRALPSDFDLSSPSSAESRPTKQRRLDPAPRRSPRPTFVLCHECNNGPWLLEQGEICVMCHHLWCESCTYMDRKGNDMRSLG